MVCFLLVLLHVLDCTEVHIAFAAVPMGVSVTLNVCLISREPLANADYYQIYIDI